MSAKGLTSLPPETLMTSDSKKYMVLAYLLI